MTSRFGRFLAVSLTALTVVLVTAIGAGGRVSPAAASVAPPGVHYSGSGVSGSVAAKALNALAAQQSDSHAHSLVNVHFILNWVPNVEFAGLWVAQKFGWWKAKGLSISYTPWSSSVFPETQVPERGGDTFGFQSGAAIAIARSKGDAITALYTDAQRSVFGLTVLSSSHITNIRQLRGKRIGYQSDELYVPETMLSSVGLQINRDWKPIPVGFNINQLTQKRVDAYLTFLTNEPLALQLQGVKTFSFKASDYGFHFYDDVMFTYNGLIQKDPALVRKVVGIVAKGFNWAHNNPDQAARITVAGWFPPKSNLAQQLLESRAFRQFSRNSSTGRYDGRMTTAYWQDSINTLFRYHEIKSKPSAAAIYTNRFNPYH